MRTLDQLLVKYSSVTDDVDLAIRDKFLSNDVFQFDKKQLQAFSQTSSKLKILCERYGLQEKENEFTRLFIIGARIKYLAENISDIWGNEEAFRYREQLYTFYNNFSVPGTKEIPLLTYQVNRIGKHGAGETNQENDHKISDKMLLKEITNSILNIVTYNHCSKPFNELNKTEIEQINTRISGFLELTKIRKKGGAMKSQFLKMFAEDLSEYLNDNSLMANETQTKRYEFIGKIFEILDLKKTTQQTNHAKMISNIIGYNHD